MRLFFMSYIEGTPRHQSTLFPESLEDYVADDDAVRVIDAFVDGLDVVDLAFTGAVDEVMGRPRYHPKDLLKLYIYGYLNQVRSSRRLERECQRNVEVMWLLGRLAPDFKTIADFRRDNGPAIKRVCRAFVVFCNELGLIGSEVAIDGSKFKAAASKAQALTKKQLVKQQRALNQKIDRYLAALEDEDHRQELGLDRSQVQAALERLNAQQKQLTIDEEAMDREGKSQHCRTEPDARIMKSGREGFVLGYNVQTSVETEHKLIVHHSLTQNGTDLSQLYPMARMSQRLLQRDKLQVLADSGYSTGRHLQRCDDRGLSAILPANRAINHHNQGRHYQKSAFNYIEAEDVFICPSGEQLKRKTKSSEDRLYLYTADACMSCRQREGCTTGKRRWISRHFDEPAYARCGERLKADPCAMTRRKSAVEAPFGTMKRAMGDGRFLSRGKSTVKAELSLSVLAYNLKRLINVVGVPRLIDRLA